MPDKTDDRFPNKPLEQGLAFDRASVRTYDVDGRLHVSLTHISKAAVNPYYGAEIPGFEALGLDPKKIYKLLRDPQELARAAPTFNNIQLLAKHQPVNAEEPAKEIVVGSTGTDCVFTAPYLDNSLVVWDAQAIEGIETEEKMELSSAYRYTPDMTPGSYEGEAYDGVMRNILGNHVALVPNGRAGSDVVVGDSNPMEKIMPLSRKAILAKGVLMALAMPMLAQDQKVDFNKMLVGVDKTNWKASKQKITNELKPKLAQDADLGKLTALLDSLDGEENDDMSNDTPPAPEPAAAASPQERILAMLKGKISDEDHASIGKMLGDMNGANDSDGEIVGKLKEMLAGLEKAAPAKDMEPPETPLAPAKNPEMESSMKKEEMVSKPAMDAAIKAASEKAAKDATTQALKTAREIREAERAIEPYVGELAFAQDSADAVYRMALETLGVDVEGVHPSAFRAILLAQPKPGETRMPAKTRIAMDSKITDDFTKQFPNAQKVRQLG